MGQFLKGNDFYKHYTERDLEKFLHFLGDPVHYFSEIQDIPNLGPYFEIYESYLEIKNGVREVALSNFLDQHFKTINCAKASILVFLLQHTNGIYSEITSSWYARLFSTQSKVLIRDLKKRVNWKEVVASLIPGDPVDFRSAVEALGNSSFEREFKHYVSAQLDFSHLPVIVPENGVAFLAISDADYQKLPGREGAVKAKDAQELSSFRRSSVELTKILKRMRIEAKTSISSGVRFLLPSRQFSSFQLNSNDLFGMAISPKGKRPVLVTEFVPTRENMAKILGEYFGIKIKA